MNVGALGRPRPLLGFAIFVTVLAIVTSSGARVARADETSSQSSPSGGDEKQARSLYERAEKNFNVGKFAEALADYQAAYEAKPLPGFLFNIAQCYRNMGNYERARFFFRRYLSIEPKAPNRRRVEELINEMSRQLEAQASAAAAAPATAPPAATPPPLASPSAAGSPAAGETKPGEKAPAEATGAVSPEPKPAEPLPAAPPPDTTSSSAAAVVTTNAPPPEETGTPVWQRWWFWTGVGAVVVGGAVAAFFLTRPKTVTPGSLDPIDGR
jgi:hypothetical protein